MTVGAVAGGSFAERAGQTLLVIPITSQIQTIRFIEDNRGLGLGTSDGFRVREDLPPCAQGRPLQKGAEVDLIGTSRHRPQGNANMPFTDRTAQQSRSQRRQRWIAAELRDKISKVLVDVGESDLRKRTHEIRVRRFLTVPSAGRSRKIPRAGSFGSIPRRNR